MRTLVAVILLGAAGWGQQPSHQTLEKGPDALDQTIAQWEATDKRLIATNRALTKSLSYCNAALDVCYKDVNEVSSGFKECSKEVDQPRLPLGVNPGECYRIGGDMSMKLISCP